ncbi:MAG: hypothetical protein ACYC05_05785 [Sulfuricella sp.]
MSTYFTIRAEEPKDAMNYILGMKAGLEAKHLEGFESQQQCRPPSKAYYISLPLFMAKVVYGL